MTVTLLYLYFPCSHCRLDCLTPPFALFLFFISLLNTSASTYVYTYASLFCLRPILFSIRLLRKLPWLSRQSDRLLTDRSLVRSQAEAPFLLLLSITQTIYYIQNKKYASRGSRTHDRAVKSRALYRLS